MNEHPALLDVLRLPDGEFALVLSGITHMGEDPEITVALRHRLDDFAEECGAKAALVASFPITVLGVELAEEQP